jgi:hypothetical protein
MVVKTATEIAHSLGLPKSVPVIELSGSEFGDGFVEFTSADKGAVYQLLHSVPSLPAPLLASTDNHSSNAPIPVSIETSAAGTAAAAGAIDASADTKTVPTTNGLSPAAHPTITGLSSVLSPAVNTTSRAMTTPRTSQLLNSNPITHPHSVFGFLLEMASIDADSCTILCREPKDVPIDKTTSAPAPLPFPPGRITLTPARPIARWKNYIITLVSHENPEEDPEFVASTAAEKKTSAPPASGKPAPPPATPQQAAAAQAAALVAAVSGPPRTNTFVATLRIQRDRVPLTVQTFDMNDPAGKATSMHPPALPSPSAP